MSVCFLTRVQSQIQLLLLCFICNRCNITINLTTFFICNVGKPRVDRLDCSLQQTFFTIKCRWNESYVIEGIHITKYRLELENGAQKLNTSLLPNDKLEYEYDASASGEHKISIIPYIDTLEGEAANRSVVIDTGNYSVLNAFYHSFRHVL